MLENNKKRKTGKEPKSPETGKQKRLMLNRIKYILIAAIISASLIQPAPAANDSTISYISINDKAYQDVELMISDGAEILVPFKQLADIFEIHYSANRVDKVIHFTTYDGLNGVINQQGVFINDRITSGRIPVFLQQGIMDNVMNEAFIQTSVAEKIFGVKLTPDYSSLTVGAQIDRDIQALHVASTEYVEDNSPKAHPDVVLPKKNGVISLNRIGLHNNMINDNMSTKFQNYRTINDTISGNTALSISGNAFNGKYRAEANMYHYRQDAFMFGGFSAAYLNNFTTKKSGNKYFYELGRVKGRTDVDTAIGTNIFGAQIWNYDYDKTPAYKLNGYVKPTSLVRVSINGNEPVTLNTYSGYYSLSEMQLPSKVQTVKIEEVNEDGTVEVVKEETYSLYGDKPLAKEQRASAYAGVWGYQNRLFRDGSNIYRGNNKKVTAGVDYQYGIKDNLTFESKLTGDKIYDKTSSSVFYRIPTNDALLVTGTQKNVNYIEGATTLNSVEYVNPKDPNLKLRGTAGASVAHDIREENTHAGYMVKGTAEYSRSLKNFSTKYFKPKQASAKIEGYHSSPDFYIASTDATSKNDRTGGRAQGSVSFNQTSVSGGYNKYYSNMNNRYAGGTIDFDEYNINASTRVPKVANVRFNTYHRRGANDLGRNKNYNYDFNVSRSLGRWANIQAGHRESVYDTDYKQQSSMYRDYYSKYADTYIDLDVPVPKNLGKFRMGHNFVDYKTTSYKNNYNMFRFGYTFPTWKRMTLGLGWGFRYHGQSGQDFNVSLGYRAKSGQMMTVGYQYSQNGGYFIDNMFTPTTNRHSVNFIFNDAYQLFQHGLKSIGDENEDKGIFEAIAFIDVNKNGKFDKKIDIPVKDIPIVTSWATETEYTNKRGRISSAALTSGVYKISLDMDSLPITVAPLTNDLISKTIKIDKGLTTKLELPLASTVGSVSGVLKITDDFERDLKITDFIVVILDPDGNEVNYSTVDASGQFYISGLAPGRYTLKLDERFIDAYGLEELPNISERSIFIPYDYNNPTDVTGQNLEYKTLAL